MGALKKKLSYCQRGPCEKIQSYVHAKLKQKSIMNTCCINFLTILFWTTLGQNWSKIDTINSCMPFSFSWTCFLNFRKSSNLHLISNNFQDHISYTTSSRLFFFIEFLLTSRWVQMVLQILIQNLPKKSNIRKDHLHHPWTRSTK